MIKKSCVILGMYLLAPAIIWANSQFNDKNGVNDSIPIDFFYSNFDRNLDSLMRIWYVQESIGVDPLISEMAEDVAPIVVGLHDSIYIQRLQKIPSVVNLTYNNVVKDYINVYTRNRNRLEVLLGLADYYFPMFEEIFDLYDIPLELKYLAVIESALNPNAVSRVGATGLWQFMLGTGKQYKLQVTTFVDERRDPVASTYAAAKFLKDLYKIYDDWVLALAAYNCGPGNVNKAIRRSGGKTSYWDIYPHLPRETRGYVPAYIGATYAMNYHKEHNINPKYIGVPPVSDTIMVNKNVNLAQVSEVLDIPLKLLRDLNPQYRRDIIPGNSEPYPLRLPASYATRYIDMKEAVYSYKPEVYLSNSFRITQPAGTTTTATARTTTTTASTARTATTTASTAGKDRIVHTIRSGETLGTIAQKYGVTTSNLQSWNNISGTKIVAGKSLVVYTTPKPANVQTSTAATGSNQSSAVTASANGNVTYYTVKSGDTVWGISQRYNGVSDNDILKWNNLTRTSKITPGMRLKIIQ